MLTVSIVSGFLHRVYLLSNQRMVIPGFIAFGALFQLVWASVSTPLDDDS
jgi:hypothetical protein